MICSHHMQPHSKTEVCERSSAVIRLDDLERLSQIARADLQRYISNDPNHRSGFNSKLLCVCLCQGAALHYIDRTTGVKDFDVFSFFAADEEQEFPPRRRTRHDFGPSEFGRNPDDMGYTGRRVDLMGRSIAHVTGASVVDSLRQYLRTTSTSTAWHLAQKAVVMIDPVELRGDVIWPEEGSTVAPLQGIVVGVPNRPVASALPGIANLSLAIDKIKRTASFNDLRGQARVLRFNFGQDHDGVWLTIEADDGSVCTFKPCPLPYQDLWFASGLVVQTPRCGIASHIYALVRDLLRPFGSAITPSGNLFLDGVRLWRKLDPSVQFREQPGMPGYYEPI